MIVDSVQNSLPCGEESPALSDCLMQRAGFAINCLISHCDKGRGYLPYFYTRINTQHNTVPPAASLAVWSYGDGLGRSVDALTLLRAMTGGHIDHPADRQMRATLLSLLGEDGLSWCPAEPWTMDRPHTRPAWLQQGTLLALTSLWQFTGDEGYRRLAERNIDGVAKLAVQHQGYANFPGDVYTERDGWDKPHEDLMHAASVFSTSIAMPLMRYYRLTKYQPALKLASDLINWALRDHDGGKSLFEKGHFHSQSRLLTALLLRGVATGDADDLALGESLYLKARSLGTLSGWFPEQINNPEQNRSNLSETCCLTDMIESAIILAQHINPTYWHDVERFAHNHLMRHQIIDTDWFNQMDCPDYGVIGFDSESLDETRGLIASSDIKKHLIGGFAGWGGVTAMSDDSGYSNTNQHCCNAAGARALYDVWHYAVEDDGKTFSLNLYFDRDHPVADITVYEGSEGGRLSLALKERRCVSVRVPEGVRASELTVDGIDFQYSQDDSVVFLILGQVEAGTRLEIYYPLPQRTSTEAIAPGTFVFHWRGSKVTAATPIQKVRPLFTANSLRCGEMISTPTTQSEHEFDSI